MTSVHGSSLGSAVHALLAVVPTRTPAQQLKYVLSPRTGASKDSVIRQLGTTRSTLNRWLAGTRRPGPASVARLDQLFERFWRINNRTPAFPPAGTARIRSPTGITVDGKPRRFLTLEPGRFPRDLPRLSGATVREINDRGGSLFVDAFSIDIPYVKFGPGSYSIETL